MHILSRIDKTVIGLMVIKIMYVVSDNSSRALAIV